MSDTLQEFINQWNSSFDPQETLDSFKTTVERMLAANRWCLSLSGEHDWLGDLPFARTIGARVEETVDAARRGIPVPRTDVPGIPPAASAPIVFIWPVPGEYRVSSGFGMRHHPVLGRLRMHRGIDISAGAGSAVYASAAGRVTVAGAVRGFGRAVYLDHGSGYVTVYGHCVPEVSVGQFVQQGQRIARVGSADELGPGNLSTGPHLHFEILLNGDPINPLPLLVRADRAVYHG